MPAKKLSGAIVMKMLSKMLDQAQERKFKSPGMKKKGGLIGGARVKKTARKTTKASKSKRPLTAYNKHVKKYFKENKDATMADAAAAWRG
jgi:hypothetical protein